MSTTLLSRKGSAMAYVRILNTNDIYRCPLHRLDPDHYRDDGSCRCTPHESDPIVLPAELARDDDGAWDDELLDLLADEEGDALLDELSSFEANLAALPPLPPPPPAPPARFELGTGRSSWGARRLQRFGRRQAWAWA